MEFGNEFEGARYKRARELLGLDKTWDILRGGEKERLLPSPELRKVFDNFDTTTNPREPNIEKKQGIVSEVLRRQLLDEDVLQKHPSVYIGSFVDFLYPLALGSRNIVLVDPVLENEKVTPALAGLLKKITGCEPFVSRNAITVPFDFGDGSEEVTIRIEAKPYIPPEEAGGMEDRYTLPDQAGLVLLFASQGPDAKVVLEEGIERRMVEGGVILCDDVLTRVHNGKKEEIELGSER